MKVKWKNVIVKIIKEAFQTYVEFERTLLQLEMVMGTQKKKKFKKAKPREVKFIAIREDETVPYEFDHIEKFYTKPDLKKWLEENADSEQAIEVYEVSRKVPVKIEVIKKIKVRID